MAPLTGTEKAAIEGFFRGKRGTKALKPSVAAQLAAYFVGDGTTLPELPTSRPPDSTRMAEWVEEWTDYAEAAGITDKAQIKNVGRWISEDDAFAVGELRYVE